MISYIHRSFLVFLAVVITVSATFLSSNTANAWSGDLPDCGAIPDYVAAIKANSSYDAQKTSYVVFKRAWTGPPFNGGVGVAVDWDATDGSASGVRFYDSGGEHALYVQQGYILNSDNTLSSEQVSQTTFLDLTCVSAVHSASTTNPVYISSYTGGTSYYDPASSGSGGGSPNSLYNTCGTLDFVCYYGNVMTFFGIVGNFIANFFTSIANAFTSFSVALADMLGNLFIPTNDHFPQMFSDLGSFFQDKFGLLTWPITFFSDLISGLSNAAGYGTTCIYSGQDLGIYSFCNMSLAAPAGIIPAFSINFGVVEQSWPPLWHLLQTALIGITVFGLVTAIYHKYMRIIQS